MSKPTEKQINYALFLMKENGYDTRYMNSRHKELGATMRQRSGTVEEWLAAKTEPKSVSLSTS